MRSLALRLIPKCLFEFLCRRTCAHCRLWRKAKWRSDTLEWTHTETVRVQSAIPGLNAYQTFHGMCEAHDLRKTRYQ